MIAPPHEAARPRRHRRHPDVPPLGQCKRHRRRRNAQHDERLRSRPARAAPESSACKSPTRTVNIAHSILFCIMDTSCEGDVTGAGHSAPDDERSNWPMSGDWKAAATPPAPRHTSAARRRLTCTLDPRRASASPIHRRCRRSQHVLAIDEIGAADAHEPSRPAAPPARRACSPSTGAPCAYARGRALRRP